jgi:hypothetical protein
VRRWERYRILRRVARWRRPTSQRCILHPSSGRFIGLLQRDYKALYPRKLSPSNKITIRIKVVGRYAHGCLVYLTVFLPVQLVTSYLHKKTWFLKLDSPPLHVFRKNVLLKICYSLEINCHTKFHDPTLTSASFVSISEVWTSANLKCLTVRD